jgi:hypothetical protein
MWQSCTPSKISCNYSWHFMKSPGYTLGDFMKCNIFNNGYVNGCNQVDLFNGSISIMQVI